MKKLLVTAVCALFLLSLITLLPDAQAQNTENPPKEGPEKKLFQTKCQKCHSMDRIQKAHLTRDTARDTVEKMRKKEGANISKSEAESIYNHLGEYFVVPPSAPVPPMPIR
jgi:hypothetical protein